MVPSPLLFTFAWQPRAIAITYWRALWIPWPTAPGRYPSLGIEILFWKLWLSERSVDPPFQVFLFNLLFLGVWGALKNISVKSVCKNVSSYMAYSSLFWVDHLSSILQGGPPFHFHILCFSISCLNPLPLPWLFLWLLSCYLASTGISPQLKTQHSKKVKICV